MKKVAVVFINENGYCISENKIAENLDVDRVKLYAAVTATRININRAKRVLTIQEAEDIFRESLSTDEVGVILREFDDETIAFGTKLYLLEDYFEKYNIARLGSLDLALWDAYKDQANDDPLIVGVVDPGHGFLSYEIINRTKILETTIRKKVVSEAIVIKNQEKAINYARETIEAVASQESERYGKKVNYIVAGVNDSYKKLESAIFSIEKAESFHRYFIDENIYLYKKILVGATVASFLGALYLVPENIYMSRKRSEIQQRIRDAHSYIQKQKAHIKWLYTVKGKTIILRDNINLRKLAKTLGYLYTLPPDKAIYKTDRHNVNVTMLYNNVILAQMYYDELKKNRHIRVTLEIGKNFNTAKVKIKIPKEYLSGSE